MKGITPSLWFDGNTEEALDFYASVFEDAEILDVTRAPEGGPNRAGSIVAATFRLAGQEFIAINGQGAQPFTDAVSFTIHCESQVEVDHYREKLTDGGEPVQCGWLKDRFGVSWQVVPTALIEILNDEDPEKAQRVVEAMLRMVKLDIPTLRADDDGRVLA